MQTIYHQILIKTTFETVFKAITTQEGLSKWWLSDCIVKPELGFINKFRYQGLVNNKMKVIDLETNQRVEWECIESDPQWIGTHVIFELSMHDDLVKLNFKHTDWKEQTEFFGTCSYHWGRHLTMLREYCETGIGQVDQKKESEEIRRVKD
jgi:uncharacterized protein YndB with AHSA1/START domain